MPGGLDDGGFDVTGGRERPRSSDTVHPQRAARLPRLLAGLQHHGRHAVQRTLLQLRGQRTAAHQCVTRSRQAGVRQPETSQLLMEQPDC